MSFERDDWDSIYRRRSLDELPWERGKPREMLVELVESGMIEKGRALDTCCGAGTNGIYLAENGFDVVGIDISSKAIEISRKKAEEANVQMDLRVQDFLELSFDDGEFDFVLDSGCFHHVAAEKRTTYIEGVHRVLKKGGKYLLLCFSHKNGPGWNQFTELQIKQLFSKHFDNLFMKDVEFLEGDQVYRFFLNSLMVRI
ncbi:MAG: class I SAM-dependent methyltransferase [Thermoplasmata archaeon]